MVVAAIVYLNRAYGHIYNMIGQAALKTPDKQLVYQLGAGEKQIKIDFLGDSLTAGVGVDDYKLSFPYLVAQKLAGNGQQVKLIDRGVPGARAHYVLEALVPQVITDQPDIVVILVGTNDIHGNIKRADFKNSYNQIITEIKSKTKAKIYLANLPRLGDRQLLKFPYGWYFNRRTNIFNQIISSLAAQNQATMIDLYDQTLVPGKEPAYYSADNFHPGARGYQLWADIIYAGINH